MAVNCSEELLNSLKNGGVLAPIVERVKSDSTLDIELRDNEIEVYYRGARVIRVNERKFKYHTNSLLDGYSFPDDDLVNENTVGVFLREIPAIKDYLDKNRQNGPQGPEHEAQQIIVRENNRIKGQSEKTDYTIIDFEREIKIPHKRIRFDLIAVKSLANKNDRIHPPKTFSIIELKYGNKAVFGSNASLAEHFADLEMFIEANHLPELERDAILLYNFRYELGLFEKGSMKGINKKHSWKKPEYIIILADFANQYYLRKSSSSIIATIEEIEKKHPIVFEKFDVKFAITCCMGYSMYSNCMLSSKEFKDFVAQLTKR